MNSTSHTGPPLAPLGFPPGHEPAATGPPNGRSARQDPENTFSPPSGTGGGYDHNVASWPILDAAAYHGPAGQYALAADPYTEADPVAVLFTVLVCAGAAIGRNPHVLAGNDRHPAAVWAVLIGQTAKAGKGTSFAAALAALVYADPAFFGEGPSCRVLGGFNSGEAVVDELRDPDPDDEDDLGAEDKRLLVKEPELARVLKVAGREGSTLSMLLRDGWDGHRLQARSRAKKSVATGYHMAMLGHITAEELRARLTDVETYGGLANRIMWPCVKRSKRLPRGGNVPDEVARDWGRELGNAIRKARQVGPMIRTPEAEALWDALYNEMGDDEPGGLLGAVIARAEPITLRLSLLYSLLDGSQSIDVPHVEAAYALWRYARDSAAYVFGDTIGDPTADRLLEAVRRAGTEGLDRGAQHAAFGRNVRAAALDNARGLLIRRGVAVEEREHTDGRDRIVLRATNETKETKNGSDPAGVVPIPPISHHNGRTPLHPPVAGEREAQGADDESAPTPNTDPPRPPDRAARDLTGRTQAPAGRRKAGGRRKRGGRTTPPKRVPERVPNIAVPAPCFVSVVGALRDLPMDRVENCRACNAPTVVTDDVGPVCRSGREVS